MTRGDRKVERDGPERDDDVPAPGGDAPNTQPPQWRGRRCSRPAIADVAQDPRAGVTRRHRAAGRARPPARAPPAYARR